jgi:hypothetical protein
MGPSGGKGSAACSVPARRSEPKKQTELSARNVDHLRGRIFLQTIDVELDADA